MNSVFWLTSVHCHGSKLFQCLVGLLLACWEKCLYQDFWKETKCDVIEREELFCFVSTELELWDIYIVLYVIPIKKKYCKLFWWLFSIHSFVILLTEYWSQIGCGILCTHLGEMSGKFARGCNIFEKSLRYLCDLFLFFFTWVSCLSHSHLLLYENPFWWLLLTLTMPSVKCSVPEVGSHVSIWSHKHPT